MFEVAPKLWVSSYRDCQLQLPTIHLGDICPHPLNDDRNMHFDLTDYDREAADIIPILAKTYAFIERWRKDDPRGVLIHCTAGVSRSATLICLYLFCTGEVKSQSHFKMIYPSWFPNLGFQRILDAFMPYK